MGCDIHSYAERKVATGHEAIHGITPFDSRNYGTFGFLANVRNYSEVTPIAPRRGFPDDASPEAAADYEFWGGDAHSPSWLTIKELSEFNYDAEMEDRRCTRGNNGGSTCEPGAGRKMTYREFFGEWFFKDLKALQDTGADRIVFWFDN